jgi:hypothetical protein
MPWTSCRIETRRKAGQEKSRNTIRNHNSGCVELGFGSRLPITVIVPKLSGCSHVPILLVSSSIQSVSLFETLPSDPKTPRRDQACFTKRIVGVPVKLNARSRGKPNGIPDDPEHHRSVATLACRLCWEVFGFVKGNLSGAQRRQSAASEERGCGKRDGRPCPRLNAEAAGARSPLNRTRQNASGT